ncbi:NAD-dependent epimerase/dehydratase family protein [Clostridium beijerinckii]|uniref:NAD-dependent epimerase/dehydratase family protein n=1 Tax=Clostridium beijerinckii TaxID=1520 RepID=UPI001360E611|nr:NAD-dependent epimerase/dehydratase family protein [Clostridium beijerinckii]MZK52735.1 NAD-dependent epimerase/dehydratase family protein [Clostridium beijerinckii]MZK60842.1 NAD-dependent epimerase/dehydratase family protein [Clostridium beijerinckii]MZK71048.1 NAD-dependent epimerase/dehydratase family protein [Clostridium beijerinckii]MZK76387.1 NAD-dependent epimerase/dehydratase family protein [Clostridium beijerinckii]MZK86107.1 NAD-dependent epimerase/dehydratase family protein [Clo
MKVLVTGGAGFIGSNVVDELISSNYEVCIIDNLSTGKVDNLNSKAVFYKCDIINVEALKLIFEIERPEVVYHFAAQIDVQNSLKKPAFDADINIIGTINILECCRKYEVKKIIYPSSAAVYGNPKYLPVDEEHPIEPISFYGISKHTPEHYIKTFCSLYNIKYTIFRYSNVYGIRQDPKGEGGVISMFIDRFLNNRAPVIFGDGEQTRDFIYVKDVAKANVLALRNGDNKIINISTNVLVTVNELFKTMKRIFNSDVDVIYKKSRQGDILHSSLNNMLAREYLGWNAEYDFENGVRETINYYKNLFI